MKQEALKFTSLWLEYGQMDAGFVTPTAMGDGGSMFVTTRYEDNHIMWDDLKYFRVVAGQEWTEKWATHLFYYNYDFDKDASEDFKE